MHDNACFVNQDGRWWAYLSENRVAGTCWTIERIRPCLLGERLSERQFVG
jgi:hypothetical protein